MNLAKTYFRPIMHGRSMQKIKGMIMLKNPVHSENGSIPGMGRVAASYAAVHFLVDFSCAFFMFYAIRGTEHWHLCLLLYNFFAFAMQMPIGLLADKLNRNAICAAAGCVLVALAYGCVGVPIAATVILGLGNALFHVGGGIEVLNVSGGKSGPLGIFVSPGAFGIYFGTALGSQAGLPPLAVVLLLLVVSALILLSDYTKKRSFISDNQPLNLKDAGIPHVLLAIGCLFVVVYLRSYVGLILTFPWKGEGYWGTALICAVVFGKAAGGILADRIGAIKASILSLGLSAAAFLFSGNPLCGTAAVFLFNMTMPITLWAVARALPGAKGFSFGLLTFGLFLGFCPVYLGVDPLVTAPAGFALASLASLALLFVGLKKAAPS